MRHGRVLLLALTAAALAGCASDKPLTSVSWLQRPRSFQPEDSEAMQMEVALVEAPVGDRFVNTGLWAFVDEQVIAPEQKERLESSGFRVGQAGAALPDELRELLESERSCPSPRRFLLHCGGPGKLLGLGPPLAHCCFEPPLNVDDSLRESGSQDRLAERVVSTKAAVVELEKAECCLLVTPALTEDGRTRLTFTPQVKHAARSLMPWRPKADLSGWMRQGQEAVESYPALTWEVTLAPGQYALVGTRWDRPGSLGHTCFVRTDEPTPVQRLLVIRTARPEAPLFGPAGNTSRPPPLALHVNWTAARGATP
jgi:hypothetical protein